MGSIEQTASRFIRGRGGSGDGTFDTGTAYLLVIENNSSSIVHLPVSGELVIGRTSEAWLTLEHASVSRKHAMIRIENGVISIADLDSRNKTRVNGELVPDWRTLSSGDVIGVGDVSMIVYTSAPPIVSRATYPESGWKRRLAEEMNRAITHRRSLAVIAVSGIDRTLVPKLGEVLRLIDVMSDPVDGTTLILMPEVDRDEARMAANRVMVAAMEQEATVRLGLAMCPTDAADTDTILLAARKALRSADSGSVGEASGAVIRIELGSKVVTVLDPAMRGVYDLLKRIAKSHLPVLINGERGVGKENAAYAVHHYSERRGSFIAKNCAGITESIAEAELFGYEKGAFTGANAAKAGLFEAAEGGTLFLDEVGELSMALQAKLLRVLQEKKIQRVGDTKERSIDVRFVAATNRNLDEEIAANRFRADLRDRLSGARVILPPLRERRCEIPMLAQVFLENHPDLDKRKKTITPEAMQVMLTYDWPGNVRELQNAVERAAVVVDDDRIEPTDLPSEVRGESQVPSQLSASITLPPANALEPGTFRPINDEIRELEKRRMTEALAAADGVKTKAADLICMPIRTFTLKAKNYKL